MISDLNNMLRPNRPELARQINPRPIYFVPKNSEGELEVGKACDILSAQMRYGSMHIKIDDLPVVTEGPYERMQEGHAGVIAVMPNVSEDGLLLYNTGNGPFIATPLRISNDYLDTHGSHAYDIPVSTTIQVSGERVEGVLTFVEPPQFRDEESEMFFGFRRRVWLYEANTPSEDPSMVEAVNSERYLGIFRIAADQLPASHFVENVDLLTKQGDRHRGFYVDVHAHFDRRGIVFSDFSASNPTGIGKEQVVIPWDYFNTHPTALIVATRLLTEGKRETWQAAFGSGIPPKKPLFS